MAGPAARAVWCPSLEFFSSSLPSFFDCVGACIDGDGMGLLHTSIVALLNLGLHILGLGEQGGLAGRGGQYFSLSALRKQILELQSIETTTFCIFVYFLSQNKVTTWTELVYWVFSRGILHEGKLAPCAVNFRAQSESVPSKSGSSLTWPPVSVAWRERRA